MIVHHSIEWMGRFLRREGYFASAASVVALVIIALIAMKLFTWGVVNARFEIAAPQECLGIHGACWPATVQRIGMIFFGLFPADALWRAQISLVTMVVAIVLSCMPYFWKAGRIVLMWACAGAIFLVLMRGGIFGLQPVPTSMWGGFTLNLFIFFCVIVTGMPIAIVLALMRQSDLPGIRLVAATFIDLVRSMPLVGILFFAVLIFPLVLPGEIQTDTLSRVIVAFAFFFGCYEAEVLRGGLQSVAGGQIEASNSLGLTYWQRTRLIVLPQAFQKSFPTTLNQFIITFKETSLVFIVGLFDVLRASDVSIGTPGWSPFYLEVYILAGLLFLSVTFSLSRYGRYLERRMSSSPSN